MRRPLSMFLIASLSLAVLPALAQSPLSSSPLPRAGQDEAARAASKVAQVTLYRNQAAVTRTVTLGGSGRWVISDLPLAIDASSLAVEAVPTGLDVRSIQFRTRALAQDEMPSALAALQATQREQARLVRELGRKKALLQAELDNCDQVSKGLAEAKSVDAAALAQTLDLLGKRRESANGRLMALEREGDQLAEQQAELARQIQRHSTRSQGATPREVREVVLEVAGAGSGEIRLNYLVGQCGWSPAYQAKGTEKDGQATVDLVGQARILQSSGEDWGEVKLTLSTASPTLVAAAPKVMPMAVVLSNPKAQAAAQVDRAGNGNFDYATALSNRRDSNQRFQNLAKNKVELFNESVNMNSAASFYQMAEIVQCKANPRLGLALSSDSAFELTLEKPVSLPAGGEWQTVQYTQTRMQGPLHRMAAPALCAQVFRLADLKLAGKQELLAGPVTVQFNGKFVGQTELPSLTPGQPVQLGLGVDSTLRARRETLESVESVQGGNVSSRTLTRVVIDNYGDSQASVQLLERLPDPLQGADVALELLDPGQPLSTDADYLRLERPHGILRWDVAVPAKGLNALSFNYRWKETHQRGMQLVPADDQTMLRAFDKIEQQRGGK